MTPCRGAPAGVGGVKGGDGTRPPKSQSDTLNRWGIKCDQTLEGEGAIKRGGVGGGGGGSGRPTQ